MNLASPQILRTPAKLPEMVTEFLLVSIRSGAYAEDARIPSEAELSRQFGVSRTVIREAVTRLKSQGILKSRQGSGVYVCGTAPTDPLKFDPASINTLEKYVQVMEMRQALDIEIAALAARRISDEELDELQMRLKAIDDAVAAGTDGMEADIAFHRSVVTATDNPYLMELWNFVSQIHLFKKSVASSLYSRSCSNEFREQVTQEHQALYAAIAARDPDQARTAARQHIDRAISRIKLQGK